MKINSLKNRILIGISFMVHLQGYSQGFVNLNFESVIGTLTPGPNFQVPITNALPGWNGYIGGSPVSTVTYNTRALSAAAISLHGTGSDSFTPIQGSYSVYLQSGQPGGSAAIGQTAQINSLANSLFFSAQFDNVFPGPQVTFAGQPIAYFEFSQANNYSIFAADISALKGQTGELRFSVGGATLLDSIVFSSTIVPEPSIYSLLGCGVLLFGAARATFNKKQRSRLK